MKIVSLDAIADYKLIVTALRTENDEDLPEGIHEFWAQLGSPDLRVGMTPLGWDRLLELLRQDCIGEVADRLIAELELAFVDAIHEPDYILVEDLNAIPEELKPYSDRVVSLQTFLCILERYQKSEQFTGEPIQELVDQAYPLRWRNVFCSISTVICNGMKRLLPSENGLVSTLVDRENALKHDEISGPVDSQDNTVSSIERGVAQSLHDGISSAPPIKASGAISDTSVDVNETSWPGQIDGRTETVPINLDTSVSLPGQTDIPPSDCPSDFSDDDDDDFGNGTGGVSVNPRRPQNPEDETNESFTFLDNKDSFKLSLLNMRSETENTKLEEPIVIPSSILAVNVLHRDCQDKLSWDTSFIFGNTKNPIISLLINQILRFAQLVYQLAAQFNVALEWPVVDRNLVVH